MSIPSSSARRRNAPNLISPLQRAHGFGVRPASCSAAKSASTARSNSSVRSQISNGNPAIRAVSAASRRALGPQQPWSTPSRCTSRMCEPSTSKPCSCSRHAATEESTPPDIATSTDGMRGGYQRPRRSRGTNAPYRDRMLEARFDDLTGASPSFRLVEPVGVLEATRAGEVVATLEAAEAAAGRGLWVAGFVTYEAAPGLDPALVVRPRDAEDPFEPCPSPGSRCSSAPRRPPSRSPDEEGVPETPPRGRGCRRRPASGTSPPSTGSGSDRGRRDLPGEPHDASPLPRRRGRARAVPRPLLRSAWRLLGLPRPRPVSGALGLARALLRAPRRRDRHQTHEGHGTARPVARRGRAVAERLLGLGEGSSGERDDRGPPPQRPRPLSRTGSVTWARRLPGRALRDRLAAHDDGVGASSKPDAGLADVFRALFPSGSVTGAPKVAHDGDHPRARGLAARGLLRRGRLPGAARIRRSRRADSTSRSARSRSTPSRAPPSTASAAASRGTPTPAPSTRRRWRRRASSPPVVQASSCWRRCGTTPPRVRGTWTRHLRRLAGSADYFGFRYDDDRRSAKRVEKTVASAPPAPCRVRLALGKGGTVPGRVHAARGDAGRRPRVRSMTSRVDPRGRLALPQDVGDDSATRRRGRRHPDADDVVLDQRPRARSRSRRSRTWRRASMAVG